jgi:hypothetical protein
MLKSILPFYLSLLHIDGRLVRMARVALSSEQGRANEGKVVIKLQR